MGLLALMMKRYLFGFVNKGTLFSRSGRPQHQKKAPPPCRGRNIRRAGGQRGRARRARSAAWDVRHV